MQALICEQCEQLTSGVQVNESPRDSWHCPSCGHLNQLNQVDQTVSRATAHNERSIIETGDDFSIDDQELQSSIPPLEQGEKIEHFVIQRLVGAGGFGYVFLAFDEKLERSVALKIPHARRISDNRKADFLREAKIAAKLASPHVVSVFEVGETKGRIWISSEYVDGQSLKGYLARHKSIPEKQAINICQSICKGVIAAHELRIIHRDLKPGNILISRNDNVMVTDFGLAFRDEPTKEGKIYGIVGTLPYMSPEQLEVAELVDRRTDVYAIGIILYEMLTGKRPYRGAREDLITQILDGEPEPPRSLNRKISPEMEAVCLKAMAANQADRYQSASELLADINLVSEGRTPTAYLPNVSNRIKRGIKQFKWPFLAAVASLLLAFLLAPYFAKDVPSSNTHPVVITTNPVGATIAVVPINPDTFEPDRDKIIQPATAMQYSLDLEPGTYLVEAVSKSSGNLVIQEVIRTVPEKLVDSPIYGRRCREFTIDQDSGSVIWPVISLSYLSPIDKLNRVSGGSFLTGNADLSSATHEEISLQPYELMNDEVTVNQYRSLMRVLPGEVSKKIAAAELDGESPVTNVSFYDALEFAEAANLRVPTLSELLFVATNRGTTNFPWGELLVQEDSNESPEDKTMDPLGFHGLASSVGEWTQTGVSKNFPLQLTQSPQRHVLGFPILEPEIRKQLGNPSVRFFSVQPIHESFDQVGFRCARSLKARFVSFE